MARRSGLFAIVLSLAVTLAALSGPASAELRYTTVYKEHLVHGSTPGAIWSYMTSHPIMDPDDGPALANITHDHTLAFTTAEAGGACAVSRLTFTWNFVITLPKAADRAKMSPATAAMWQELLAKMRWHETHRQVIFLGCAKVFLPAAEKMTAATCASLKAKVPDYVNRQYAACMRKQRQFGLADVPSVARLQLIRAATGVRQ